MSSIFTSEYTIELLECAGIECGHSYTEPTQYADGVIYLLGSCYHVQVGKSYYFVVETLEDGSLNWCVDTDCIAELVAKLKPLLEDE